MKYIQIFDGYDDPYIQSLYMNDEWMDFVGGKEELSKYYYIIWDGEYNHPILVPNWYDEFIGWIETLKTNLDEFMYVAYDDDTDSYNFDFDEIDKFLDDWAMVGSTTREKVLEIGAVIDYNGYKELLDYYNISIPDVEVNDYYTDMDGFTDIETVFNLYAYIKDTKAYTETENSFDHKYTVTLYYLENDVVSHQKLLDFIFGQVSGVEIVEVEDNVFDEIVNSEDPESSLLTKLNKSDEVKTIAYEVIADCESVPDLGYDISAVYNSYDQKLELV